jgi:hypothetical protein
MDGGVEDETVAPSVPSDVDEPDKVPVVVGADVY